jgi:hypothetical protein
MSELRKKLASVVYDAAVGDDEGRVLNSPDVADAIIAAMPGRVLPLEWMDCGFEQDADFVDTTQTYQIQEGVFWYAAEVYGHVCGTNGAAMVAAQRHHTAAILSAFGVQGGEA